MFAGGATVDVEETSDQVREKARGQTNDLTALTAAGEGTRVWVNSTEIAYVIDLPEKDSATA